MNATPRTVAESARRARAARPSAAVYTTSTGDAPRTALTPAPVASSEWDWCFVCSRPTNHVGEHDALVEAGLVAYEDGSVRRTPAYEADLAAEVADAEYRRYAERVLALEF